MKKEYIVELREEEADELMDVHWVSELVRCKDCKHKGQTIQKEDGTNIIVCWNQGYGIHHPIDWFCADGESR